MSSFRPELKLDQASFQLFFVHQLLLHLGKPGQDAHVAGHLLRVERHATPPAIPLLGPPMQKVGVALEAGGTGEPEWAVLARVPVRLRLQVGQELQPAGEDPRATRARAGQRNLVIAGLLVLLLLFLFLPFDRLLAVAFPLRLIVQLEADSLLGLAVVVVDAGSLCCCPSRDS